MPHTLHDSVRYERVVNIRFVWDRSVLESTNDDEAKEIHSYHEQLARLFLIPHRTVFAHKLKVVMCMSYCNVCWLYNARHGERFRLSSSGAPLFSLRRSSCEWREGSDEKSFTLRFDLRDSHEAVETWKAYSQGSLRYEFAFSPFRSAPNNSTSDD